jgi:EmrB/QacA subfamily drug resistance transporter
MHESKREGRTTIMESPAIGGVVAASPPGNATRARPPRHPPHQRPRRRWLTFSGVLAAMIMDLLDSTVTSTAAPAIRADLHGSYPDLQWVTAAYTMALAVTLLVGARLGDTLGRRPTLVMGIGGFTLASAACAAAPTPLILILTRAAQGAFGALIMPQTFGLISDLFPATEAKKAWTVLGPVMSLGAVAGPIVAGVLIRADLLGSGWRMIFLINVPIGAFALVTVGRFRPAGRRPGRSGRLDLVGVALAAAGTVLLIFPLVQGRELGWPLWTLVLPAGSLLALALLGRRLHRQTYETGRQRRRPAVTPLIEVSVFGRRSFVGGLAFAVVFSAAVGGTFLTLNVFMQVGLGYTPLRAGLAGIPWALGAMIGSGLSGALMARLGRRLLHLGLAGMGLGLSIFCATLALAGTGVGPPALIVPLLVFGAGMGTIFSPMMDIILGEVASAELGSASSVLAAAQQLGLSLGVAVLGTAFFWLAAAGRGYRHAASGASLISLGLIGTASLLVLLLPANRAGQAASR